ncbi:MAG: DUF1572 family protein [Bacteroidota bacterium]
MESPGNNYLASTKKLFAYYRSLGDAVIARLDEEQLHWQYNEASNSVAAIIKHIAGNSISRWTDFLTADGEKQWRNRDEEFEDTSSTKQELTDLWNKGWECLFNAIDPLTDADLPRVIYIRNEGHTVTEAINRQLAHLPYHIGQMVFVAKLILGDNWDSLTIAKGQSSAFNADKFAGDKKKQFFTDDPKR